MRAFRNTIAVLLVTALSALVLYAGVEIAGAGAANRGTVATTIVATGGQTYLCPTTGCSAPTCHGATNLPAPTGAPTGDGASGNGSSGGGQTLTCPRTGCTASSCHGATGSPPPSGGGQGYGRRHRNDGGYASGQDSGVLIWQ